MRVGIFPGSFDPIHDGHIAFACAVGKQFKLDKTYLIAEPRPRRKQGVRALEHRNSMLLLAIENDPHLGLITLEEARFAIDSTWPRIKARLKGVELYMLMGEENLDHIIHWPQIDELIEAAPTFVIGIKDEDKKQDLQEKIHTLQHTKSFPFVYHIVKIPQPRITSRSIRAAIRKGSIPDSVPSAAGKYIAKKGLYASSETGEK